MKGNQIDTATGEELGRDEELCRIAGDLVERGVGTGRPSLMAAQRDHLQAALAGGGWRGVGGARRRWLVPALASLAAVGAGGVAAVAWLHARPIGFAVEGAEVGPGAWVETAAARLAMMRFSDGTSVALSGSSAARVKARSPDGATVVVERGHARFDVIHRARTHWLVAAGPFEIVVTGTAFDVDWSAEGGRALTIDLRAGSVIVRGSLAGAGLPLRAGQRLVADVDRGALSVVDSTVPAAASPGVAGAAGATEGAGPSDRIEEGEGTAAGAEERAEERTARVERSPPARSPTPTPTGVGTEVVTAAPARALVEPEAWPAPALPGDSDISNAKRAAGGSACVGWSPQVRFDRSLERVEVGSNLSLAFSHPVLDHGRSWCGAGSLRVDARFDLSGTPNRLGHRPRHAGEVLVDLPSAIDLTGKTVTVHFFVEGPPDIRFGAQLFAVDRAGAGDPKWVGAGFTPDLTTGRWWTLSHTFERDNRLFEGGTSAVDRVDQVTLQVYATGKDRVWTGRVFVDDLGWQ